MPLASVDWHKASVARRAQGTGAPFTVTDESTETEKLKNSTNGQKRGGRRVENKPKSPAKRKT